MVNKSSSNKNKFHFYLVKPKGRLIKPIDLDPRRVHKIIEFIEFFYQQTV